MYIYIGKVTSLCSTRRGCIIEKMKETIRQSAQKNDFFSNNYYFFF